MVRKKLADVKTASKYKRRNPIHINAMKLKKAQNELANIPERTNRIHTKSDQ